MKKSKKILVALAFFGLSAGVATTTVAQTWNIGATTADNVTATISGSGDNLTITISGTGAMQNFADYYYVPWYGIIANIKTLVINSGVTSIGNYAFFGCYGLTGTLTIPNSVTTIGGWAFGICYGLTSVTIPNGVTTIGDYAFNGCRGLTSLTTIPNSVTTIGMAAFIHCYGLTSIDVDSENNYFSSENGVLFNKSKTVLICCPGGKTGSYVIPNGVTTIGYHAFAFCLGLTSLTIPNSVTTIEDYAFVFCFFDQCSSLEVINILKSAPPVAALGVGVFDIFSNNISVNVACGMNTYYENDPDWSYYFTNITEDCISPIVNLGVNNDTLGTTLGSGNYNLNDIATLYAIPKAGNIFTGWSDGNTNNPRTIPVTQYITLIANFATCATAELEAHISALQADSTDLQQQLSAANIHITALQNDSTTSHSTITDLQEQLSAADNHIIALQNDSISSFSTISALETQNTNLQNLLDDCDSEKVLLQSALDECMSSGVQSVQAVSLQIYPNPVKSQLRISNYELRSGDFTIFNIAGQIVGAGFKPDQKPNQKPDHNGEITIDVSHLPSGVYFIKVGNMVGKFIKE